jgi:Protein of unknown function (DUF4229)
MLGHVMRATMSYTILRLLLFFAAILVLYLAGVRGYLMLPLIAAVVSGLISWVVLSRLRESMAGALGSKISGFRQRLDDGARAEDVD